MASLGACCPSWRLLLPFRLLTGPFTPIPSAHTRALPSPRAQVLAADALRYHDAAWPADGREPDYLNLGEYHWRDGGEKHYNTPAAMVALQLAARTNARSAYEAYSKLIDEANAGTTLRGLFQIGKDGILPEVPLEVRRCRRPTTAVPAYGAP